MDDKKLQDILDKIEVPAPSDDAKSRAIASACEEFKKSEKTEKNIQGSVGASRQTSRTNKKWSFDMSKFTMRHLAGTTAIVLAVSVVFTSDYSPLGGTKDEGREIAVVDSFVKSGKEEQKLDGNEVNTLDYIKGSNKHPEQIGRAHV